MKWTIYVKDLGGNVIPLTYDPADSPSELYHMLVAQNEEWEHNRLILCHPDQEDPFSLSNLEDNTILTLIVLDTPFQERWSYTRRMTVADQECYRALCYWDCKLWGHPYEDPFVTVTHCTLPLYILSTIDQKGFSVRSSDFSFATMIQWYPTLRSALASHQHYMNGSRMDKDKGMTDEIIDHIICLYYKHHQSST